MATPAPEEWIPKAEAALLLGISTRQIERYAHAGRIRMKLARLPNERTDRNIYATKDILALKEKREEIAPALMAFPEQVSRESPVLTALMTIIERTSPPAPRIEKAWLTLDEAATYSGLPVQEVGRLVREQRVYAMGRGSKTWRVQRESLDRWGKADHGPTVGRRKS